MKNESRRKNVQNTANPVIISHFHVNASHINAKCEREILCQQTIPEQMKYFFFIHHSPIFHTSKNASNIGKSFFFHLSVKSNLHRYVQYDNNTGKERELKSVGECRLWIKCRKIVKKLWFKLCLYLLLFLSWFS